MTSTHAHDPLHSVTLAVILNRLVEHYGWEELAEIIPVNCFKTDPSEKSSLKFCAKPNGRAARLKPCTFLPLPKINFFCMGLYRSTLAALLL